MGTWPRPRANKVQFPLLLQSPSCPRLRVTFLTIDAVDSRINREDRAERSDAVDDAFSSFRSSRGGWGSCARQTGMLVQDGRAWSRLGELISQTRARVQKTASVDDVHVAMHPRCQYLERHVGKAELLQEHEQESISCGVHKIIRELDPRCFARARIVDRQRIRPTKPQVNQEEHYSR